MTIARSQQIDTSSTPYVHCLNRCCRKSFLCGDDPYTGINYDHRKEWIVDRMKELSAVYLIDICAFSVMSNHFHVVLKVQEEQAEALDEKEVAKRWMELFKGHLLVDRWLAGTEMSEAELDVVGELIAEWRQQLTHRGFRCQLTPLPTSLQTI